MIGTLIDSPAARPTPGGRGGKQQRIMLTTVPKDFAYRSRPMSLSIAIKPGSSIFEPLPDNVALISIVRGIDGAQTTMRLAVGLDIEDVDAAGSIGRQHFAQLLTKFSGDRLVRAELVPPTPTTKTAGDVLPDPFFVGYPMATDMFWDGRRQNLSVTCVSLADELLTSDVDHQILSRYMRRDPGQPFNSQAPDWIAVEALPLSYNAGNKPNRSQTPIAAVVGGKNRLIYTHTTDGAPDATWWNYADALRNLIYFYMRIFNSPIDVDDMFDDTDPISNAAAAPTAEDLFLRQMSRRVEDISLRGMNLMEALSVLLSQADLHFEFPFGYVGGTNIVGQRLRIWAPVINDLVESATPDRAMISAKLRDLPRQSPFTDNASDPVRVVIERNRAAFSATITRDRRVINQPVLVGATKRYEVTLLLRPGWKPLANLDDVVVANQQSALGFWEQQFDPEFDLDGVPISAYHSRHPDFKTHSDVLRQWIFPDSNRYKNQGYGRATRWLEKYYSPYDEDSTLQNKSLIYTRSDFGGGVPLSTTQFWVIRDRPLLDRIGRDNLSGDQSPLIQFHFNAPNLAVALQPSGWVRYMGQSRILPDRAGIMLLDDNLLDSPAYHLDPTDDSTTTMIEAYINGTFAVAVTCTIEGDERLMREGVASSSLIRLRSKLVDVSDRFFLLNRRGQNSSQNTQDTDVDNYEDRDDAITMTHFANRWADQMAGEIFSGPITVPWIDDGWELGDSFSGVQGLGLCFDRAPQIVRKVITFNPDAGYSTQYHLSDMRHAPELRT